jgi:hypothetical protein
MLLYRKIADPDFIPQRLIRDIVSKDPPSSIPEADQRNLKHIRAAYDSCMDETGMDSKGSAPLLDVVKQVVSAWRGHDDQESPSHTNSFCDIFGGVFKNICGDDGDGEGHSNKTWVGSRKTRLTNVLTFLHSRGNVPPPSYSVNLSCQLKSGHARYRQSI